MPEIVAKAIAKVFESVIWFFIGAGLIASFSPGALYFWWPWNIIVLLGFALLGPPLWRRYGLPKWYKGP